MTLDMQARGRGLIDEPLAEWARLYPDRKAIIEGETCFSFGQLEQAVSRRADALAQARGPATVQVRASGSVSRRLVDFLGIVRSGRCAAVADPEWPEAVRAQVLHHLPAEPADVPPANGSSPFYIGYTSGSTGLPKGFMRDHRSWSESFRACIDTFGPAAMAGVLAPGGLSHSLFLFGMLLGLWTGGGLVVQPRFSAQHALASLRLQQAGCLVAVPSQLLMMLEQARRRAIAPIDSTRLIMISGARWMRDRTSELRALFPQARIVEFYGASETSFVAWMDVDEQAPAHAVGWAFPHVQLDIRNRAGDDEPGMIFVRSPMLFSGYVGAAQDPTAAVRDGEWLSVRDMGYIDTEGRLCLVGRANRMLVTSGKNLFPEEVESVLASFPGVEAASVHGVTDQLRGKAIVALLKLSASQQIAPAAAALAGWCRERLDSYKVPRRFMVCDEWPHTSSGKADHPELARRLEDWDGAPFTSSGPSCVPCLRLLH